MTVSELDTSKSLKFVDLAPQHIRESIFYQKMTSNWLEHFCILDSPIVCINDIFKGRLIWQWCYESFTREGNYPAALFGKVITFEEALDYLNEHNKELAVFLMFHLNVFAGGNCE